MQEPEIPGRKTKNDLNFKKKMYLKLQYCLILKLHLETLLNYLRLETVATRIYGISKNREIFAFREHKLS